MALLQPDDRPLPTRIAIDDGQDLPLPLLPDSGQSLRITLPDECGEPETLVSEGVSGI